MAQISLRLDKRRANKLGLFPIQFLLTHNGKNTTISTKLYIKDSFFLGYPNRAVAKNCPNARVINEDLSEMFFNLQVNIRNIDNIDRLSVTEVKMIILDMSPKTATLSDAYRKKINTSLSPKTKMSYEYTLNIWESHYKTPIKFTDITLSSLKEFENILIQKGLSNNTRAQIFSSMAAVFNMSIDEGLCSADLYPFRRFKIKRPLVHKLCLTLDEFCKFSSFEFSKKQVTGELVRDLFFISFYLCGMNLVDICHLKKTMGNRISFTRQKTRMKNPQIIYITIQPELSELIKKYSGKDYLFNFLENKEINGNYNLFLTRIMSNVTNIQLNLKLPHFTLYQARYTWASFADKIGVDEKVISKSLGHADVSIAGRHYITYDWERTDKANRDVIDYVKTYLNEYMKL